LNPQIISAEVQLPCADLQPALDFFVGRLGFRIEAIFPADAPRVATLSGYGLRLRLAPGGGDAGTIRIVCNNLDAKDARALIAPNGTRVEFVDADPPVEVPALVPEFVITRAGNSAGTGRAGMIYRDLIPSRLGGRFIASHITIEDGGPVDDWVHYHRARFQMIFCRRGQVRVAYEDQGPPVVMRAGDCVLQPPRIRHRVLESSAGAEVIEIGCPALHETLSDHDMVLPTGRMCPEREFDGQFFLHHVAADALWTTHAGFSRQETGMAKATRGLADVCVIRREGTVTGANCLAPPAHTGELLFGFLLDGSAVLECAGVHALGICDTFVIPPRTDWDVRDCSPDMNLLQVTVGATGRRLCVGAARDSKL
jgi:quercetin dioxygenase-like cupin family protein